MGEPLKTSRPGKLIENFDSFDGLSARGLGLPEFSSTNYNVVGTDYKSFAIVYFCIPLLMFKSEFLWILTRDQHPPKSVLKKAYKTIQDQGIDKTRLHKTRQYGCPSISWFDLNNLD